MLGADTTCYSKSGAAFLFAHFLAATAVLAAPASGDDGSGALVERADLFGGAMCFAHPSRIRVGAAALHRARHCLAVVFPSFASHRDGVVDARVQCAVPKGAVLEADKLAGDLRGVTVWLGTGQLHRVLAAQAPFLPRRGGATFSKTLA